MVVEYQYSRTGGAGAEALSGALAGALAGVRVWIRRRGRGEGGAELELERRVWEPEVTRGVASAAAASPATVSGPEAMELPMGAWVCSYAHR